MRVAVVGSTGLIGSRLKFELHNRSHDVVDISRSVGVDAFSGTGLAEALAGSEVVVDVSNPGAPDEPGSTEFFEQVTRNLLFEGERAGVRLHIALSVVGLDYLRGSEYFDGKRVQESMITASAVPYTIVRATQFFELVERIILPDGENNTIRLPRTILQPIASGDVAELLATIAGKPALQDTIELAGPERIRLAELARLIMSVHEDMRRIVEDEEALYFGSILKGDPLLPGPDALIAETSFGDWLRMSIPAD